MGRIFWPLQVVSKLEVKAFVNGCEVIHSGIVHVVGDTLQLVLAGLPVNIFFLDDNKGARWETTGSLSSLEVKLYNLNGTLPEGRVEPVLLASDNDSDIFLTFLVSTIDKSRACRSFQYTVMLKGKSHG